MEECGIEEAFLRRSFSLADRGSSVQLTLRRLCDKLSSSYYCNCNCYCNRDSYMKCNNNDNNIVLVVVVCCNSFVSLIVSIYNLHALSAWHTLHSSSLLFSSLLSSTLLTVLLMHASSPYSPHCVGSLHSNCKARRYQFGSLSSRSACKLA